MPSVCPSYFLSSFSRLPLSFPLHLLPLAGPQLTHSCPQPTSYAHSFETVIRYLGGLLSANALSSSPILLSKKKRLMILIGCSCLRFIPLWGCLCLLLILICEWACFIPFVFVSFLKSSASHDGRGICSNSTHIVTVSVLIADETTFNRLLHYRFSPDFSYPLSLILSRSIHCSIATCAPSVLPRLIYFFASPPFHALCHFADALMIVTHVGVGVSLGNVARPHVGLRSRTSRRVALGPSPAFCYVQVIEPCI